MEKGRKSKKSENVSFDALGGWDAPEINYLFGQILRVFTPCCSVGISVGIGVGISVGINVGGRMHWNSRRGGGLPFVSLARNPREVLFTAGELKTPRKEKCCCRKLSSIGGRVRSLSGFHAIDQNFDTVSRGGPSHKVGLDHSPHSALDICC